MTIAIRRQPRFHRFLVVFGLVGALAVAAVAAIQLDGSDLSGNATHKSTRVPGGQMRPLSLETQNGYLVPEAVLAERAADAAQLRLQDGYLSPVTSVDSGFVAIQDGYLTPPAWVAPVEGEFSRLGVSGPQ